MKQLLITSLFSVLTNSIFCQALDVAWLKGIDIEDEDHIDISDIIQDHAHNGFIFGSFEKSLTLGPGVSLNLGGAASSFFISKFSDQGNFQWARVLKAPAGEEVAYSNNVEACVDGQGNAIVAGYFESSQLILDGGGSLSRLCTTTDCYEGFIAKYGPGGNFIWVKKPTVLNNGSFRIDNLAADDAGNIYVVGGFSSTQINFGNGITLTSAETENTFFVKYKPDGTAEWAKVFPESTSSFRFFETIKISKENNIFITGRYGGSSLTFGNGITIPQPSGYSGGFVVKYTQSGNAIGVMAYESEGGIEAYGLEVDADENMYIMGICVDKLKYVNGNEFYDSPGTSFLPMQYFMKVNNSFYVSWVKGLGFGQEITTDFSLIDEDNILLPCAATDFDGFVAIENDCGSTGFVYKLNTSDGKANALYKIEGDACSEMGFISSENGVSYLIGLYEMGQITLGDHSISTNGLGFFLARVDIGTVGLADSANDKFQIILAPNPNHGRFSVSFGASQPDAIILTDMLGRTVLSERYKDGYHNGVIEIQLNDCFPGTYLLKTVYGDSIVTNIVVVH